MILRIFLENYGKFAIVSRETFGKRGFAVNTIAQIKNFLLKFIDNFLEALTMRLNCA